MRTGLILGPLPLEIKLQMYKPLFTEFESSYASKLLEACFVLSVPITFIARFPSVKEVGKLNFTRKLLPSLVTALSNCA